MIGYLTLALIIITFPIFYGLLTANPGKRHLAFAFIGAALFVTGSLRIDSYAVAWPLWVGTVRGLALSPVDTLAFALILTRPTPKGGLPLLGPILFYGAILLTAMFISKVWMASFFAVWQYVRVALIFIAVGGECHRNDYRSSLLTGLACGLMLQAGYVIEQKATGVIQAVGTVSHQNTLGMMVELSLLPLFAARLAGDRRKIVLLGILAGAIIVVGGGSRATLGIVGCGLMLLILLSLIRGVTNSKLQVLGFGVLLVALATPLAFVTLHERFGSKSIITEETERLAFERAAAAIAQDHPFGVGGNMYVTTANTGGYATRAGVAWNFYNRSAPVHNGYLLARAETGWLGEVAFILLLFGPIVLAIASAFQNRQGIGGEFALGSAIALATNAVHNNYEFASHTYTVLSLLFLNLALISVELRAAKLARLGRPLQRFAARHLARRPVDSASVQVA